MLARKKDVDAQADRIYRESILEGEVMGDVWVQFKQVLCYKKEV